MASTTFNVTFSTTSSVKFNVSFFTTSSTTDTNSADNWEFIDSVAYNIETYYLWVILFLGFPGNSATIITIIKMSPARSLTVYIALLAVVDNLAIVIKLLIFVLTDHGVDIGSFGCKFLGFCGNFLITLGNWILVALSVERFAAVWFPLKLGQNWTFRKSLIVVGGMTVPLIGLFLHLFWTTDYVPAEPPNTAYCGVHAEYVGFITECWYWINIVIYAILPYVLLLLFNSLIVAGIIMSRKVSRRTDFSYTLTNTRRWHIEEMALSLVFTYGSVYSVKAANEAVLSSQFWQDIDV
ncbi:neuropeptide SIFamide receptor-like [Haliotis rubra]|uniref:neuropeptide SIFamide receptor-like n=1 Tax=Haliotis rubra TaxID=36100 RepID=UPI001EE527A4|nr:neuropeptide SIFamide receptor-like [Haliotis rubra]